MSMRNMMPMFILIGLLLLTVIGVLVLQSSATAAVAEVNDTVDNETDELSRGIFTAEYGIMFGIAGLLFIVALYLALRTMLL
jgi:NADH:ubiquinone oxidoreductase subunit 6 (subunit J)